MSQSAPYGQTVWAYHGPFFPHLQVITFRLLGVSTFTCRIPQYVAAFLAVALLCGLLIQSKLYWSAIGLAAARLGDRALVESLYGRMEGFGLMFLAAAFYVFTKALASGRIGLLFLAGIFVGTACGFHPVATVFAFGIAGACLLGWPRDRWRALGAYAAGFVPPAILVLALVAPHFREAFEQFLWHGTLSTRSSLLNNSMNLWTRLQWSRAWIFALIAVTVLSLAPALLRAAAGLAAEPNDRSALFRASALFSVLGCLAVFSVSAYPYYVLFFTVWPTIAVLIACESELQRGRFHRVWATCFVILLLAWIPSAAWNALRWREARLLYPLMDPSSFVERVHKAIPSQALMKVSPEYFIISRPLGRDIVRLPLDSAAEIPPAAWLVLSQDDLEGLGGRHRAGLSDRLLMFEGPLYSARLAHPFSFVILGPSRLPNSSPRGAEPGPSAPFD